MPNRRAKAPERQWIQNLQQQARDWQPAKPDDRYLTDQGVPVTRRHKRSSMTRRPAA
jgi:hypothetical protein